MLDPRACRQLLVYGGTFDPPHRAHIDLPLAAATHIGAEGVLYTPAGQPPHKPDRPPTAAHHRLAMLRLALDDRPVAAISTWELDRPGKSYTIETLEHLRRKLGPAVKLRLLIGADMAAMFDQWRSPDKVMELGDPLVLMRPGHSARSLPAMWQNRIVPLPTVDVSSTELRRLIAENRWDDPRLKDNLHPQVAQYIREHRLYAGPPLSA